MSFQAGLIDPTITKAGIHRNTWARKDLEDWLKRVELPYHSPHKFRHGHDVSALKAISQNLMHKDLKVTDGVYAILTSLDVRQEIIMLGKTEGKQDKTPLVLLLRQLLKELENS